MFTRIQFLNKECTHNEYYAQFVTGEHILIAKQILSRYKFDKYDKYFNVIPLENWERSITVSKAKMDSCGDYLTKAGGVCILKEAARQIVNKEVA